MFMSRNLVLLGEDFLFQVQPQKLGENTQQVAAVFPRRGPRTFYLLHCCCVAGAVYYNVLTYMASSSVNIIVGQDLSQTLFSLHISMLEKQQALKLCLAYKLLLLYNFVFFTAKQQQ